MEGRFYPPSDSSPQHFSQSLLLQAISRRKWMLLLRFYDRGAPDSYRKRRRWHLSSQHKGVLLLFSTSPLALSNHSSLFSSGSKPVIRAEPEIPNPYTTELQSHPSIERTWIELALKRVAALSSGSDYTLYNNPNEVRLVTTAGSTCSIWAT